MKECIAIHCITYNHEKYISEALDGFLRQKVSVPFTIYVSDDNSTDRTPKIIQDYVNRYPGKIIATLRAKNIGITRNFVDTARQIKAEFVCLCEGDDYWTDDHKLQKQYDFLQKNPSCSICFHPAIIHYEDKSNLDMTYPSEELLATKSRFGLHDLLKQNIMLTTSVMYRWRYTNEVLEDFPEGMLPCDWFLHLLHAEKGEIGYIRDNMAVYRKWGGGCWDKIGTDEWALKYAHRHKIFYQQVSKHFGVDTSIAQASLDAQYHLAKLKSEKASSSWFRTMCYFLKAKCDKKLAKLKKWSN